MTTRLLLLFLCGLFSIGLICAQDHSHRRQRTPEEEATKQTERLVRELGIKDSVRIDTIYKMHLKYAFIRRKGLTRSESIHHMLSIHSELSYLLTAEEFERFMNHPAEEPRRPHGANFVSIPNEAQNKPTETK